MTDTADAVIEAVLRARYQREGYGETLTYNEWRAHIYPGDINNIAADLDAANDWNTRHPTPRAKRCWLGHRWTAWSDPTMSGFASALLGVKFQTRRCNRCGASQTRRA